MDTSPTTAGRPRVLLVNPNSNAHTTALMTGIAAGILDKEGIDVVGLTAAEGPPMIIDPKSLAASAVHVHNAVRTYLEGPDGASVAAVIVAAIGDPGRADLDRQLDIPVVGIGAASILAACGSGRRFGMATSTPLLADSLAALVAEHGCTEWFTGVRLTPSDPLALAGDPEQQYLELADAVRESNRTDGAEAVVIAGGPLSDTARRLAVTSPAAIIQPVPSACTLVLRELAGEAAGVHPVPGPRG